MPRGRSATSVHSDTSDMDVDALAETEMGNLQRQFRIMEGDRQAYSIQSQELIRKQRLEMQKLQEEQEEMHKQLCASQSQARKLSDSHDTKQIRALLHRRDQIEEELEKEKLSQAELEQEILSTEKRLTELRKGKSSTFQRKKSQAQHTQKATRTLENKLDRALVRFNEQLATNSQLREDLEALRVDRFQFQQLYRKLDKELQEIRREIGDVISMSTAAYDARVEAQTKMTMMKEKAVKDLGQYSTEMKELERLFAHEQQMDDFMTTKYNERTSPDDIYDFDLRHEMREQRRSETGNETEETLGEMFQKIQKVTGQNDLEMLVTKFIQVEDRNFALFNFVNEQNTQADALRDQIKQIKQDMESFQAERLQQEQEHNTSVRHIEEQQRDAEAEALEYEAQANEITKILDQIKSEVIEVFNMIDCDRAAVDDLLGSSTQIRDTNILTYLSLVEERTNELLTVQAFFNSKDVEKDYDPKLVVQFLLGQNPEMQKPVLAIQRPVIVHDYKIEELLYPDEENRPLTLEELRQRIMNKVLSKEEAKKAGKVI